MKKFSKVTRSLIAVLICFVMTMSFVSCQKPGSESNNTDNITFDMQLTASEITKGTDVSVFGVVQGSEDTSYEVEVKNVDGSDGASYIDIVQNGVMYTLKVNKNVSEEKQVTVEGYPNAKPELRVTKTLTIKANVSGATTIDATVVKSGNGTRRTYVRKGDEVELNVVVSTTDKDKGYTVKVDNPKDMPNLVTIDEDGKITVNEDVTENKTVTITVISNANSAVTKSFQITVKPPKSTDAVGNLKQSTIDKIGNLKLTVKGTLSDVQTKNGVKSESVYDFTTYLDAAATKQENEQGLFDDYVFSSASWTSEWNIRGNKNVLSNTYVRSDTGLTQKRFVNKNNIVVNEVVTDSYSNELTWESQRYWNHLGYLDLSLFEQDPDDENLYTYEMEYGTIESDIYTGATIYTPSEDEYLMMYLAWSLTPILDEQFYQFALRLDENGDVSQIIASTYENNLYDYDDEGTRNNVIGSYYTSVVMEIEAYGDDVSVPEIKPYEEPTDAEDKAMFGYLKTALANLAAADKSNYTFKVKDTSTYAPSYDSSDYEISGSEGVSAPTTSATGTWDGKVHTKPFTSTEGEVGYMGIVANEGVLLNKTIEYSDGGYKTDVYGFKQNSDDTYEQFEYANGKLTGKSRKSGNVSSRLPGFDVSPYVFNFSSMTSVDGDTDARVYAFSLKDAVIIKEVANEFCMKDYANYATSDAKQAFNINVYYNRSTKEVRLLGVTFAYNIIDTYYGYYTTEYSNFGSSKLPDDLFSSENYVTKEFPQSWSYFDAEYRASNNASAEIINAEDLLNKVFGKNSAGVAAADAIPSPLVFSSIFADNFSNKVFHDYFNTGDKNSQGNIYKPEVKFNVWLDDVDLDSNRALSLKKYNEIIDKLSAEMEKCGFTDYEDGDFTNEGTSSKSRQKCYINDNAGDHGLIIRVENIGYKTFYIHIYAKGDWSPSK